MLIRKVLEVIALYRRELEHIDLKGRPDSSRMVSPAFALSHCRGMLDKMDVFVRESRTSKVMRWLGFVQGVLWVYGYFTIDELKSHNRPPQGDTAAHDQTVADVLESGHTY